MTSDSSSEQKSNGYDNLVDNSMPSSEKEKVLVLCRAVPEESKKYFQVVCVAGVTDKGELRRLYPVPFKPFAPGGGIPFHKKEWITAVLRPPDDKRDKRVESRKVDMTTVKVVGREDDDGVRRIIKSNLALNIGSIEESGASLGFIRPKILDYECEIVSTEVDREPDYATLDGMVAPRVKLDHESIYHFVCQDRSSCTCLKHPHRMGIHDWEANELYRNVARRDKNPEVIKMKMREKWLDWMKTRDTYFMVGTHHRWKNWMVISVLYLRPH